jgi:hypothetical protein
MGRGVAKLVLSLDPPIERLKIRSRMSRHQVWLPGPLARHVRDRSTSLLTAGGEFVAVPPWTGGVRATSENWRVLSDQEMSRSAMNRSNCFQPKTRYVPGDGQDAFKIVHPS